MQAGMGLKAAVEALPAPGVMPDIQAAIDYAAQQSGGRGIVATAGRGLLTWRSACQLQGLSAAVPYYGGGVTTPEEVARTPAVPVLAHFGERDHWIPPTACRPSGPPEVEVHVYTPPTTASTATSAAA